MMENNYSGLYKFCEVMQRFMSESVATQPQAIDNLIGKIDRIKEILSTSFIAIENIEKFAESLSPLIDALGKSVVDSEASQYISVPGDTMETIREFAPLIPEDKKEQFEEIVAPEQSTERKLLTKENVMWLIALIVSIISMLNSFNPQELSDDSKQFISKEFDRIVETIEENDSDCSLTLNIFPEYINQAENVFTEESNISGDIAVSDEQADNQAEQN